HLMIVGCVIDRLANRKLRHRELLLESSVRLYLHESVNAFLTTCPGQHSGISHHDSCYNVWFFASRLGALSRPGRPAAAPTRRLLFNSTTALHVALDRR